jgi:hypothetical protein
MAFGANATTNAHITNVPAATTADERPKCLALSLMVHLSAAKVLIRAAPQCSRTYLTSDLLHTLCPPLSHLWPFFVLAVTYHTPSIRSPSRSPSAADIRSRSSDMDLGQRESARCADEHSFQRTRNGRYRRAADIASTNVALPVLFPGCFESGSVRLITCNGAAASYLERHDAETETAAIHAG